MADPGEIIEHAADLLDRRGMVATCYTGVPAAGEAATSPVGDFLFGKGTGLLNTNNYLRIGWTWARTSLLDYPYGGLTYFGIRILNWHINNPI
jgi:hypothetical protein